MKFKLTQEKTDVNFWIIWIVFGFLATICYSQLISAETNACGGTNEFLGTLKQLDTIILTATCDDCTYVNVTAMTYPNGTTEFFNLITTKSNKNFYRSFSNTTQLGCYTYTLLGDKGGVNTTAYKDFMITPSGTLLSSAQSTTYVLIFVVSLLIFIALIITGLYLPASNDTNETTGYIIAVSNLKYVKFVCIGIAYGVGMVLAYLSWMLSHSFLPEMEFLASLFKFLFYGLAIIALPAFILLCYFMIANWTRDKQIGDLLSRGLTTRG